MPKFVWQLAKMLVNSSEFFNDARAEGWKPAFVFFLWVTLFISVATPIVNYLSVESTDFSSSFQSQILAYNFVKMNLFAPYGAYVYLIEAVVIFAFAIAILLFLTLFLHVVYRLIGGQGAILNAWKAPGVRSKHTFKFNTRTCVNRLHNALRFMGSNPQNLKFHE